jgi:protoheme IX farnesyltransferase|tara:strand:- start:3113 stop:4021 length:909 start_codon:yes stop_codon:yes gene_type:complete
VANAVAITNTKNPSWREYLELCKPKVVLLLLVTAVVGMQLASPNWVPIGTVIIATIGIGFAASSAAVINHIVDASIDAKMQRTKRRPIVSGNMTNLRALAFSAVLGISSMLILVIFVNPLTAVLSLVGLIGYAVIYTMFLKHATPQNIVIGGLAGALPPLIGWAAITNTVSSEGILLVLIIFTWTPAHFWALAIDRIDDYKKADVPMLPVTHGIEFTKTCVLVYSLALWVVSVIPFVVGMSGSLYLICAAGLGGWFSYYAWQLKYRPKADTAIKTFMVSVKYLLYLFSALLVDHYLTMMSNL